MQVPEPRFYLKNPKDINETLICMQAKYCGQRVFISTGEKVRPSEWDFNKQRATVSRKNLSASTVNMFLDRIVSTFKEIFRELLVIHDLPPAEMVTDKLLQKIDEAYVSVEVKAKEKITFYKFIEQYIEECRPLKALGTIKTYQSTYKHLSNYSKLKGCDFDFPDITISWRSGFLQYLQSTGSSKNTEGKHIKNIKVFLNEATERGLNSNLEFRSKSFSKPSEDVEKVFLTDDEITSLINLDLSNDRLKAIVRDYYIISCYTSLRYSDFVNIRPEHIKENTIEMRTKKTGEDVIIPIAPAVRIIFEKYSNNLPKAPCNQVFNNLLKEVCRLAKINETVTVTKTIGGIRQTKSYEKYELISCHTGRRTMISNAVLEGIPTSSIMLISGHKSLKVFQQYVRISKQQNAEALLKSGFFK